MKKIKKTGYVRRNIAMILAHCCRYPVLDGVFQNLGISCRTFQSENSTIQQSFNCIGENTDMFFEHW